MKTSPRRRATAIAVFAAIALLTAFTQPSTSAPQPPAITGLAVSPVTLTLRVAETGTLKTWVQKSAPAVLAPITFTSSDTSIARVDSTGLVTALKLGTASITVQSAAEAGPGVSASRLTQITRVDVTAAKSP